MRVRKALDERDGVTSKKRHELYEMFSELAGHPSMDSPLMLRSESDGNIVVGPFIEPGALGSTLYEMGRLALWVGEYLDRCFPGDWQFGRPSRASFVEIMQRWINIFGQSAMRNDQHR